MYHRAVVSNRLLILNFFLPLDPLKPFLPVSSNPSPLQLLTITNLSLYLCAFSPLTFHI